jgi:hypothetical protein
MLAANACLRLSAVGTATVRCGGRLIPAGDVTALAGPLRLYVSRLLPARCVVLASCIAVCSPGALPALFCQRLSQPRGTLVRMLRSGSRSNNSSLLLFSRSGLHELVNGGDDDCGAADVFGQQHRHGST